MDKTTENNEMILQAGSNKMELVDFRLKVRGKEELFGINVAKVVEIVVIDPEKIVSVPSSHESQIGLVSVRGRVVPIFDMARFLDFPSEPLDRPAKEMVVLITEFSHLVLGFFVHAVSRIRRFSWEDIHPVDGVLSAGRGARRVVGTVIIKDDSPEQKSHILQILDIESVAVELGFFEKQVREIDATSQTAPNGHVVLLVEDSVPVRKALAMTLSKAGYTVFQAENGKVGLDIVKSTPVDIVVSDVEMPVMDGYSMTRAIREIDRLKHLPVLLNSSMSGDANVAKGHEAGATDYIVKFEPHLVLEAITRHLKKT